MSRVETFDDYQVAARKTAGTDQYLDRVWQVELIHTLYEFVELAKIIDRAKKAASYGRNIDEYPENYSSVSRGDIPYDVFHGVLGIAGEAGEIVDLLLQGCVEGTLNVEKMKEEQGDNLWYHAILADGLGTGLAEIAGGNRDKLAKRWEKALAEGRADFK